MKYGKILLVGAFGKDIPLGPGGNPLPGFDLISIIKQVKDLGEVDEYAVFIDSPGGYVNLGGDVYEYLQNLGKPVNTIAMNECCSIATKVLLSAEKGKRFIIAGTKTMIHNPWGMVIGTAKDLANASEEMQDEEDEMLSFYAERTGTPEEGLKPLMDIETYLTEDEAVVLGFVDKILSQEEANTMFGEVAQPAEKPAAIKALAIFNPKNKTMKQDKKTVMEKLMAFAKKLGVEDKVKTEVDKTKALDYKTNDGKAVHVETEATEPAVGDLVTVDGQPAPSATLTLEDKTVIETDADSKISAIESAEEEGSEGDASARAVKAEADLKKANEEIVALKASNKKLTDDLAADKAATSEIEKKLDLLAASITSKHEPETEETRYNSGKGILAVEESGSNAAKEYRAALKKKRTSVAQK